MTHYTHTHIHSLRKQTHHRFCLSYEKIHALNPYRVNCLSSPHILIEVNFPSLQERASRHKATKGGRGPEQTWNRIKLSTPHRKMILGPVSYLDCIVFCIFLAPQLILNVGVFETVLTVLQVLPFLGTAPTETKPLSPQN